MSEIWYNIGQFFWEKPKNTFYGNADELFTYEYNITFPNQARQFYMLNTQTKNFRRFRLKTESKEHWLFESEDNIKCEVKKEQFYIKK